MKYTLMTDKDALELLNMFTTAAQIAKSRNKFEHTLNLNENDLNELFQKAFPFMKDKVNKQCIIKNLLANN